MRYNKIVYKEVKYMEEQKTPYYGDILSKGDIVVIGNQIYSFESLETNFQEMKENLSKYGITIAPRFLDPNEFYKGQNNSQQFIENFNNRIAKGIVSPFDVTGYYVSGHNKESDKDYENVPISYDRYMLETLSNYGVEEAVGCLEEIGRQEHQKEIIRR